MAMGDDFSASVAEITAGRWLRSCRRLHLDPGLAAEIFVLEPDVSENDGAGPG